MSKTKDQRLFALIGLSASAMLASLYLVFVHVPTERVMGPVQRIFYFHVPSAWVGFLAFLVAAVAGMAYLLRRDWRLDALQVASAELGIVFSTIVLVTGSLWARPIWNTWWTWDPRLTTTLVMWLYYVAASMLRRLVDGIERQARFSALLYIVGFVNVPLVFLAIRLWRTIHPVLFTSSGFALEPSMLLALGMSLLALTLLYFCVLIVRVRLGMLEGEVGAFQRRLTARVNGDVGGLL
jgi:heme exporter protein C